MRINLGLNQNYLVLLSCGGALMPLSMLRGAPLLFHRASIKESLALSIAGRRFLGFRFSSRALRRLMPEEGLLAPW